MVRLGKPTTLSTLATESTPDRLLGGLNILDSLYEQPDVLLRVND